jgi:sterol-4alpha-carboxylate 3-dehydrogenase (decarboxylating)
MASVGAWAYSIFILVMMTLKLRRVKIGHLAKGCCWSIEKAKQRLGYEPVADQDVATKRWVDWAAANL